MTLIDASYVRRFLLVAVPTYLIAAPAAQMALLNSCFDSRVSLSTALVIFGSAFLISGGYVVGFIWKGKRRKYPPTKQALKVVAVVLLAASVAYCFMAALRVFLFWDAFSQGPTVARIHLVATRTGVSVIGFFNAALMGAPAVYVILVVFFVNQVRPQWLFKTTSVIIFGLFTFLIAFEGGRLPYLMALAMIALSVLFVFFQKGSLKTIGATFIASLTGISILASAAAVREFESRETAVGRQSEVEVRRHYREIVGSNSLESKSGSPGDDAMARGSAVRCFYVSHTVRSIDKILLTGPYKNLFGFYELPNYYKILELVGIAKTPWVAYSEHYDINGLFVGVLGALLIDFSWFGLVIILIIGFFIGRVVSGAASHNGSETPLVLLSGIAIVYVILAPLTDMTSNSQFQSMMPWLAISILYLWCSLGQKNKN